MSVQKSALRIPSSELKSNRMWKEFLPLKVSEG